MKVRSKKGLGRTLVRIVTRTVSIVLLNGLTALGATAQSAPPGSADEGATIEADGTVNVPAFRLPPSMYLSDEVRAALPRKATDPEEPMLRALASGNVGAIRSRIGELMAPRIKHHADLYPVTMRETTIAGVTAIFVTPVEPVPRGNRRKILLNLPGGGFVMGAAAGTGMVESIPLAAMAGIEIVSITYRQAPEAHFPAANEDVEAVYRELLETHRPKDIGIFGCSAGGLLTAESMAWFQKEKLPLPAAIGIFCASADARWGGDSRAFGRPFQGLGERESPRNYFREEDLGNPLASPILAPDVLERFPPTLIVTATRAMEMSAAVNTHRELIKLGAEAELHMWDGLGHAFFYNIDLPESREAFQVMADFFGKHLQLKR